MNYDGNSIKISESRERIYFWFLLKKNDCISSKRWQNLKQKWWKKTQNDLNIWMRILNNSDSLRLPYTIKQSHIIMHANNWLSHALKTLFADSKCQQFIIKIKCAASYGFALDSLVRYIVTASCSIPCDCILAYLVGSANIVKSKLSRMGMVHVCEWL